jgi:hypothetical protein
MFSGFSYFLKLRRFDPKGLHYLNIKIYFKTKFLTIIILEIEKKNTKTTKDFIALEHKSRKLLFITALLDRISSF